MIFHDWKLWPRNMGKELGEYAEGDIIKLNEGGTPVEFYVAKRDYESGLNGAGRTLVVRKEGYDLRQWNSSNVNIWASCTMRTFLNIDYIALLGSDIQELMGITKYYYTPGNGNYIVTTRSDAVFLLSMTELGLSHADANVEGSALPIAATLRIAYEGSSSRYQWTRSPAKNSSAISWYVLSNGVIGINGYGYCTAEYGSRPAFTLPATMKFDPETNLPI